MDFDKIITILRTVGEACVDIFRNKKNKQRAALLCIIGLVFTIFISFPESTSNSPIELCEGEEKQISERIKIRLMEVTTIEVVGWPVFKRKYYGNKRVLGEMYASASIKHAKTKAEEHIAEMDAVQWDKFLDGLKDQKMAKGLRSFKFAHFRIYLDNKEDIYHRNRIYCRGNILKIPEDGSIASLELAHVFFEEAPLPGGEKSAVYFLKN